MQKSGSELLIYVLLIGGFLLFNYIMQQLARKAREQQEAAERETMAREAPEADADVLEDIWGRPPEPMPSSAVAEVPSPQPRAAARVASAVPAQQRTSARMLFRDTHELRHAIVLMTVLGPCRALEPPEDRH